ncbi:uncharacterized protein [Acropora muricata]|uniref:uncharacterized protein isoform X1 n=1 Tax=Acropora muricata TaxID=159855 RepID=UPI0034E51E9B
MAEDVLPKLEIVLKKLEAMETKLDNLEGYVKNVDAKVSALTMKVETLEVTTRNAMKSIEELDRGLAFLNNEVEELKKLEKDCTALRQEVLYMGVYQRRENLRFYGIEEDPEGAEDTRQVLIDFLQSELGIEDASDIEFQRVHRIGPFNQQASKPRQIIARFLRYPDRERVMSNARILKGKHFGISADLPKEIVDRRKKLLPKFFATKKAGKAAYFRRAEPDKLFIDGRLFST